MNFGSNVFDWQNLYNSNEEYWGKKRVFCKNFSIWREFSTKRQINEGIYLVVCKNRYKQGKSERFFTIIAKISMRIENSKLNINK